MRVSMSRTDSPSPTLLAMAAPLVVSFWMRAAVTFVDTIYAASLGDAAVAAIGLAVPFEFLMIAVWVGLSTGLTSALSRAMGADQNRRIEQYLRHSWRIAFLLAPLFTAIGASLWWLAPSPALGLEPDVARNFQIYGTVMVGGAAWTTFWSVIPDSLVKAHQDTRSTMWAGIWSNIVNVALNTLFLFVFHWGIFGIALSTVLGRIAGLLYALRKASEHEARRKQTAGPDGPLDPQPYRRLLGLALPASLTFGLVAIETQFINVLLTQLEQATAAIAAYSIYYRISAFALQPVIATSVAMLPFAARRIGQSDILGIRRGLYQANLANGLYCLLIVGPLMVFAGPWIARSLSEQASTAAFATFALYLVPIACLSGSLFLLCRPVFEAMDRGRPGLVMAVLRYVVFTAPMAWLGIVIARSWDRPALYGLLIGLLAAAALSSAVFYVWLDRALCQAIRPASKTSG